MSMIAKGGGGGGGGGEAEHILTMSGFHLFIGGGGSSKSLQLVPLFSRAGRNASSREVQGGMLLAAHSYAKKEGLGMRLLRSLVGFGVSPHGQLCLPSHLHSNSISLVACKF